MRWIDQTEFGTEGNCTQAAIASILGLPLEEVPNFIKLFPGEGEESIVAFWEAVEEFIEDQGYWFKSIPVTKEAGRPDVLYLASGKSRRGYYHMVVMKGYDVFHDPHPNRAGLMTVEYAWLLVPHDPGLLMLRKKAETQPPVLPCADDVSQATHLKKMYLVHGDSYDPTGDARRQEQADIQRLIDSEM